MNRLLVGDLLFIKHFYENDFTPGYYCVVGKLKVRGKDARGCYLLDRSPWRSEGDKRFHENYFNVCNFEDYGKENFFVIREKKKSVRPRKTK
jgi:hypothetical protein